jgi:hypothetical protein
VPKNETFIGPGSWQSFEISSSKTVRAEGAAMLRRLTDCQRPRYGGRGMLATQGKHTAIVMTYCQRIGDFFVGRADKGSRKACSCHVEEGLADARKLALAA